MNIIAIDIGTSNCKAVILNKTGKVLKSFKLATKPIEPKPGWNEQNPETIFNAVVTLLKQSFSFCGAGNVHCVSFSAAMHGMFAVNAAGKPLINMITWADLRSARYARELREKPIAKKLYKITGVPVHAMSPLCKIIWLRHEQPQIFKNTFKFISIKEYIFFKLFGKYIVDNSIAAATGFFDEVKICWNNDALKTAGIKAAQLSELVSISHFETEILPSMRKKLGLRQNVPFVLGASDGALANIGSGLFNAKFAALTVGTSGAVRITSNKYISDKFQRLFCYYVSEGFYILGGAINNGGVVLQWLIEKILQENFKNEAVFKKIIREAFTSAPGCGGLLFLPYILGERAPMWDENARGAFVGLTANHSRANLTRAVLEGICFALNDVLLAVEEASTKIEVIYLSGGITQTKKWVQLLADVTGKKIVVANAADASALGAAFTGMKATGLLKKISDASAFLKSSETIKPVIRTHNLYKKYFMLYKQLYPALKNTFTEIEKTGM